jgi:DNA-binding NarL/FixJ family response regulator
MNAIFEGQQLYPRELEVALLIAQGLSNKEIARKIGISVGTVKNYVSSIMLKESFTSRYGIIVKYIPILNSGSGI